MYSMLHVLSIYVELVYQVPWKPEQTKKIYKGPKQQWYGLCSGNRLDRDL